MKRKEKLVSKNSIHEKDLDKIKGGSRLTEDLAIGAGAGGDEVWDIFHSGG